MRLFLIQLGWEFRKLAARPRTWFAFVAAVLFELTVSTLLRFAPVRSLIARDVWKMRWDFDEVFSGLTTAAHMLGEATTICGGFGMALIAGEIVAKESEDGTLGMALCRPVSRSSVWLQKFIVCAAYGIALTFFMGVSALSVGLAFEGRGALLIVAPHEEVIGTFDYATGLGRYWLGVALFALTALSGIVVAFAFSCFNMRPAAATALALSMLIADTTIRVAPELRSVRPWCMTTRMLAWRQVFNDEIPWTRIRRSYAQLAYWNLAWLGIGWLAFRRRDLKP